MLTNTQRPIRFISVMVALFLIFAITLSVCPALAASAVKNSHACCKTSTDHSHEPDTNCQVKCVAGSPAAVTPASPTTGAALADIISSPLIDPHSAVRDVARTIVATIGTIGPPHPIYERHSALLI